MPSNLRALADVLIELSVYNDRGCSNELESFYGCSTYLKFDVLYNNLEQYLDDVTLVSGVGWNC